MSFVLVLALTGTNVVFGGVWEGRIQDDNDDVEQEPPGSMYIGSSDLEFFNDGGVQVIGLRFVKVYVPAGATIDNAYVEFQCDETKGGTQPVNAIIQGELTPSAPAFSNVTNNVTDRPTTTAQVLWIADPWTAVGQKIQTSNIAPVLDEIVNQAGWGSGNALVLIFSDDPTNPSTGIRCAEAGPGDDAALLHIEWSVGGAKTPNPPNGAIDVSRDTDLSWGAGPFAAPVNGHKVYFSANSDDVINGVGPITQSETSYDPGRLDWGTTYYWRVDEVNGAPDYGVYEGKIWSFTTELLAYPIENVTATASSEALNRGAENAVNGSGLDDSGLLHGKDGDGNMWLSDVAGPQPSSIEFEFDQPYKLHEMWVWNSNGSLEPMIGFGFKDVTVEYSANGTDYTTLGTTHEFARAPGVADYEHNTTIDFGGVAARNVRLTANSNWGGIIPQFGLSEVRFFFIPVNATQPYPDSGATDVDRDVVLGWRAGRGAVTHDVYVSADEQAVIDSTAPVATVSENSHGPLALDLDTTHYWKVNEVNEAETPSTWESAVWSFTTKDHIVVDDFESYNDLDPTDPDSNRIFNVWIDGFGIATNGSLVGYENPPFCERDIVNGGKQSMPFFYNNTGGAASSEAELTLTPAQDWTAAGVQTLAVYFHGTEGNTGQLYVKINGTKVPYGGSAGSLPLPGWQVWNIDLATSGASLQSVTKLAIGVDGNGATGTLYFDDIALYVVAPVPVTEVRVAAGSDDAEEEVDTGNIDLGSSDLELPYEGTGQATPQVIGLRFVGIPVPKGATITDAWVRFQVDETKGGTEPVNLIIEGELSPSPATFSSAAKDISSRSTTTAKVQWSVPNWTATGEQGPDQTTTSIASIIQEIVNQNGWSGSSLVLIFRDDPANPSLGVRCAESINGSSSGAALLHIDYQ
jgi:hypothetical protein